MVFECARGQRELGASAHVTLHGYAPDLSSGTRSASLIKFSTSTFSLALDSNGTLVDFTDKSTGTDYAASPPRPFLRATVAGRGDVSVSSLELSGATVVTAVFDWPAVNTSAPALRASVIVHVETVTSPISPSSPTSGESVEFLRLTVASADGAALDTLRFGEVALVMPRHGNGRCQNGYPMAPCDYLATATSADDVFAVVTLPLSPIVEVAVDRSEENVQVLGATSLRQLPLVPPLAVGIAGINVSVALWGGPAVTLPSALRSAEVAFELPRPRIDGIRAKDSPAMQQG